MASGEDDGVKAADVQFGQIVHQHLALAVAESSRLHHRVPEEETVWYQMIVVL